MTVVDRLEPDPLHRALRRRALLAVACGALGAAIAYGVTDRDGGAAARLAVEVGIGVALVVVIIALLRLSSAAQGRLDALVAGDRARSRRIGKAIRSDQLDDLSEANRRLAPQWAAEYVHVSKLGWLVQWVVLSVLAFQQVARLRDDPGDTLARWFLAALVGVVVIGSVAQHRAWRKLTVLTASVRLGEDARGPTSTT